MTRKDLVQTVCSTIKAQGINATYKMVDAIIDAACNAIATDLVGGGEIRLPHIGNLYTVDVAERQGRNPRTGEAIVVPAHRSARFTVGSALKSALR